MKRKLIILGLIGLLFTANVSLTLAQNQDEVEEKEFIILYDEGHEQFFTMDLMSSALSQLNESLDTSQLDVTVRVIKHTGPFNSTNLQGSNLVIISNPGYEDDGMVEIEDHESIDLYHYMQTGGSILYMSNPYSENRTLRGHAAPLNDLVFSQFGASVVTGSEGELDTENTTLVLDDFNSVENDSYVKLYNRNISPDVLVKEPKILNDTSEPLLIYHGARVSGPDNQQADVSGNTSVTAYTVNKAYEVQTFQQSPQWMYGSEFGDHEGRAMMIGSTIMFSDLPYDGESNWIDQAKNLPFFSNIVAWLMKISPVPEPQPIVTEPFSFFIRTDLLGAFLAGFGFLALIFAYFIYKGRISPTQVFDVFEEDKKTKKTSSDKSKSEKPKKQKKRKKRERRKRV